MSSPTNSANSNSAPVERRDEVTDLRAQVEALQKELQDHKVQLEIKAIEVCHHLDMYQTVKEAFDKLEGRYYTEMEQQRGAYKEMCEMAWGSYGKLQAEWKCLAEDNIALKRELLEIKYNKD